MASVGRRRVSAAAGSGYGSVDQDTPRPAAVKLCGHECAYPATAYAYAAAVCAVVWFGLTGYAIAVCVYSYEHPFLATVEQHEDSIPMPRVRVLVSSVDGGCCRDCVGAPCAFQARNDSGHHFPFVIEVANVASNLTWENRVWFPCIYSPQYWGVVDGGPWNGSMFIDLAAMVQDGCLKDTLSSALVVRVMFNSPMEFVSVAGSSSLVLHRTSVMSFVVSEDWTNTVAAVAGEPMVFAEARFEYHVRHSFARRTLWSGVFDKLVTTDSFSKVDDNRVFNFKPQQRAMDATTGMLYFAFLPSASAVPPRFLVTHETDTASFGVLWVLGFAGGLKTILSMSLWVCKKRLKAKYVPPPACCRSVPREADGEQLL